MKREKALQAATELINPPKPKVTMKAKVITLIILLGPSAMFAADKVAHFFGFCLGF